MTTHQTIDGVPRGRDSLVVLTETFRDALHRGKQPTFSAGDLKFFITEFCELRALLDGPVAAFAHDGGNNQKGDGSAITGATTQGFHSSGDGGGCTFTFMPAAQAEQPTPIEVSPICCGSCPGGCVIQGGAK